MKPSRSWIVAVFGFAAVSAACNGGEDIIYDDFSTAGFARLVGVAVRADSTPLPSIFVSCGPTEPGSFGLKFDTETDGRFDVTVAVPLPVGLPADGRLVCSVRAPAHAPTVVHATLSVPFAPNRNERVATVVTLAPE